VQVNEPEVEVTVYSVIADPPFDAGAVQEICTDVLPRSATTSVGASGTVAGTTALEATEAVESPTAFVAITVNVYEVPLVNPVTMQLVEAVVHVNEPGVDVTV
jgi:hypothetical protein